LVIVDMFAARRATRDENRASTGLQCHERRPYASVTNYGIGSLRGGEQILWG